MLEVALALILVVLSAGFFLGVVGLAIFALNLVLPAEAGRLGGAIIILVGALAAYLLKFPWNVLLKYYRYEAHTLRPIKDDETNDRDAH